MNCQTVSGCCCKTVSFPNVKVFAEPRAFNGFEMTPSQGQRSIFVPEVARLNAFVVLAKRFSRHS